MSLSRRENKKTWEEQPQTVDHYDAAALPERALSQNSRKEQNTMNHWELLVVLIVSCLVFGIPVVLAVTFFRLMVRNRNEHIRLRLEVGKLADELEQVRKQKGAEGCDSESESG